MPPSPGPRTRRDAGRLAFRRARPADAAALVEVQEEIYAESRWFVGDGPPSPHGLALRLRGQDPHESLVLLALVRREGAVRPPRPGAGAEVAGWLELHRLPPQRLNHVAVLTLAVASAHRRRGLGRELLRRGLAWGRRVGVLKVSLNVRAGNTAAIALYRSEEFVEEGRERRQILTDAGFEDNVIMARFLPASR